MYENNIKVAQIGAGKATLEKNQGEYSVGGYTLTIYKNKKLVYSLGFNSEKLAEKFLDVMSNGKFY